MSSFFVLQNTHGSGPDKEAGRHYPSPAAFRLQEAPKTGRIRVSWIFTRKYAFKTTKREAGAFLSPIRRWQRSCAHTPSHSET